ncbi:MAG: hypothetical protein H8E75_00700, partial [Puniceicoccaceae bacterium]|nr:hypothetical protein [Puniceicoccaceae bacterium]
MSSEEDNTALRPEAQSTGTDATPRKRAATKAAKKVAKKAVKKRAAKEIAAAKSPDPGQADLFTPGEVSP